MKCIYINLIHIFSNITTNDHQSFENSNFTYFNNTENNEEKSDIIENINIDNYFSESLKVESSIGNISYISEEIISDSNLDKKGSVCIENITYKDNFRHFEFIQLVQIFFNSRHLITSINLTKEEEKLKKKLLTIFCKLNWGAKDSYTIKKLQKPMQERLFLIKNFL